MPRGAAAATPLLLALALASTAAAYRSTANGTRWCSDPARALYMTAVTRNGTCAYEYAQGLSSPRSVLTTSNGDLLVLEAGAGRVRALFDANANGVIDDLTSESALLATYSGLNHGLALSPDGAYVYASTEQLVVRWAYTPGARTSLGSATVVLNGMPSGGHRTRTVVFHPDGTLYVAMGSATNVDATPVRSHVVRCSGVDLSAPIPNGGYSYSSACTEYGGGMRNAVALAFGPPPASSSQPHALALWAVENGCDNLQRADLGGDIHTQNPGEEMNVIAADSAGKFFGYPYCWSEYDLGALGAGRGSQWRHPNFPESGPFNDSWCRDAANVIKPTYQFPAHNAPLGLAFVNGTNALDRAALALQGAYVALHGSWNRVPASGYKVAHVTFDANTGLPLSHAIALGRVTAANGDESWRYRPVGLALQPAAAAAAGGSTGAEWLDAMFGQDLYVTSDTPWSGVLVVTAGVQTAVQQQTSGSSSSSGLAFGGSSTGTTGAGSSAAAFMSSTGISAAATTAAASVVATVMATAVAAWPLRFA